MALGRMANRIGGPGAGDGCRMSAGLSQVDRLGTKGTVEVDIDPGGPAREFRQYPHPQRLPLVVQLIQRIVAARNWTLV